MSKNEHSRETRMTNKVCKWKTTKGFINETCKTSCGEKIILPIPLFRQRTSWLFGYCSFCGGDVDRT